MLALAQELTASGEYTAVMLSLEVGAVFPHDLGLIGMRDVRDYKVASSGSQRLNTSSPFNIKVRSITLGNFSFQDVQNLYQQHTEATGQIFTPEAIERAFYLTDGQPWLGNALAKEVVEYIAKNPAIPIMVDLINLSGLNLDTGWLVIFDRRSDLPPVSNRTTTEEAISPAGRNIIVIRG